MPLDAIDAAIEEWEAGNADLKNGALAIMKWQRDEILKLTAALEECRQLLAQAFNRPAQTAPIIESPAQLPSVSSTSMAVEPVAVVGPPKRKKRSSPVVMKLCGRCAETRAITTTATYCKECLGLMAGQRSKDFHQRMREIRAAEVAPVVMAAVS